MTNYGSNTSVQQSHILLITLISLLMYQKPVLIYNLLPGVSFKSKTTINTMKFMFFKLLISLCQI